jgi:hypothetical protein
VDKNHTEKNAVRDIYRLFFDVFFQYTHVEAIAEQGENVVKAREIGPVTMQHRIPFHQ